MPETTTRYSYIDYNITQALIDAVGSTVDLSYGGSGENPIQLIDNNTLLHSNQLEVIRTRNDEEVTLALSTDYTVDTSTSVVKINDSSLADGDKIRIARSLKESSRYVDWTNTILEESQLDFDANHNFFLTQEALDLSRDALRKGTNGQWNGESLRSYNCSPATTNSGWVTLGQVSNLIAGAETATISDVSQWSITSGSTITLTGFEGSLDEEDLYVQINGILQEPNGTAYTVAGTNPPVVTLNTALESGQTCYVRLIQGTIAAIVSTSTINGSALVDDTVTVDKLFFSAGDPNRVIAIGSGGTPTVRQLTHEDISDFDTAVGAKKLNQFQGPDGNINMASNQITSLASGTAAGHAVNKGQLDAAIAGVGTAPKFSRNTNQTITTGGTTYTAPTANPVAALVTWQTAGGAKAGTLLVGNGDTNFKGDASGSISVSLSGSTLTVTDSVGVGSVTINIAWYY